MWEFVVLGLVPGTQIQVTFLVWIAAVVAGGVITLIIVERRLHTFRNVLITLNLLALMHRTVIRP